MPHPYEFLTDTDMKAYIDNAIDQTEALIAQTREILAERDRTPRDRQPPPPQLKPGKARRR